MQSSNQYFTYKSYVLGILLSLLCHLVIGFLSIVFFEKTRSQAKKPTVIYTVSLESSSSLGGINAFKKGDFSKHQDGGPEPSPKSQKIEEPQKKQVEKKEEPKSSSPKKPSEPKTQKAEKGKDLVKLKKLQEEKKRKEEEAKKKKEREEQKKKEEAEKKRKEEEERKKLEEQKRLERKKRLEEKKRKEQEEAKRKAEQERKRKEEELRQKRLEEAKKKKAENDFNELINKARNRNTGQESYNAGGRGYGGAVRGSGRGRGGGVVRDFEFVAYQRKLQTHIKRGWRWSNGNGSLSAIVQINLSPDGVITGIRITESSGNTAFDNSVQRAVRKASPVPPPPSKYVNDFRQIRITFDENDT